MSCLDVALKAGIPDLVSTSPEGTSVEEIAKKIGAHPDKLVRVMHLLTAMDLFTEVSERHFRLTSVGRQYRKDALLHPMFFSQYPPSVSYSDFSFVGYDVGFHLYDALTKPGFAESFAVNKTAFNVARNTDKGSFEDMFTSPDPTRRERFALAMKGMGVFAAHSVPRAYPWQTLPKDAVVVDVGGGSGHIIMAVLKKFPHLKAVVQDVESGVSLGRKTWREEFPEAVQNHRVEFQEHDFFTENPVKGADAYYMRAIIHGPAPLA